MIDGKAAEAAIKRLQETRPSVIEGEPGAEWELGVQYGLRLAAEALRRLKEGDSDAGAD